MKDKQELPKRKSLRLEYYDYSTAGAYFITVCTHNRKNLFSRVVVGAIHESTVTKLTVCGEIVEAVIQNIPAHLGITVDQYVIMPNHVHILVMITKEDTLRAIRESPLQCRSIISNAVGYIKMNASKRIRLRCGAISVWQRGFHDHIIRNLDDYEEHAKYIHENPARWYYDELYTEEVGDDTT